MPQMILRADDFGFTEGIDKAILETISQGLVTAISCMVNLPERETTIRRLSDDPAIDTGLHVNIVFGSPVADHSSVRSLVDERGYFIRSSVYRQQKEKHILYEDAVNEVTAQIRRFEELFKKKPAYIDIHAMVSVTLERAVKDVAARERIPYISLTEQCIDDCPIYLCPFQMNASYEDYDPGCMLTMGEKEILHHDVSLLVLHPGYCDDRLMEFSTLNRHREKDLALLMDSRTKEWLQKREITPVSIRQLQKQHLF